MANQSYAKMLVGVTMHISTKTKMVNQSSVMPNKDVTVSLRWKNGLTCVDLMVRNVIVLMDKFYMV
jgi:hypothetical protein